MDDPIIFDMEFEDDAEEFDMEFETSNDEFDMDFGNVIEIPIGDYYDGDYNVTPGTEEQVLRTRGLAMADDVTVEPIRPATTSSLGSVIVGEDLQITPEGVLSVQKANAVEQNNTRPITAAAVYTEVGNINALLQTI
jgi:hypothetical protein